MLQATSPRSSAIELTDYMRSSIAALLAVAAVFVVSRRLAGALQAPLGPLELWAAGLALAGLAWIGDAPCRIGRLHSGGVTLDALLISLATLAIASSLSFSGSHPVALAGFWAVVAAGEIWNWRGLLFRTRGPKAAPRAAFFRDEVKEPDDLEPAEPPDDVLQQLTLRGIPEGGHELSGWLRMPLAAGQRTGSLHVAFCPSFDDVPAIQAEQVSGPDCRVKASQVLPYGARLDVKLEEAAREEGSVLVWLYAACSGEIAKEN
jgi:hypothetical protein